MYKYTKIQKRGFSLVEVLVVMFIVAIAFTSFYSVATVGTKYIIESKNRLGAVALANEKMEIVRNLAYENIGTQESIEVEGNILKEEQVVANGRSYDILTAVRYIDDPMDGTADVPPIDAIPNDYKIVDITVSWTDSNGQMKKVASSSRFVPPGLETTVGGSPLSINVSDGDTLLPISQASIHITNNVISPAINDIVATDNNGHVMLPAAKISDGNHLSITKNGYETIETMDSSATFTPVYGHVNVVSGFLNTYNYFQNKLSTLIVRVADFQNNPIGDIGFSIGGGKVIGHNELGENVFNMANTTGTTESSSGEREYPNISPGNYFISMSPDSQYEFVDYDPSIFPAFLSSDSNSTYTIRVADKNIDALFVEVKDNGVPQMLVAGARVTLTDGATDIFTDKLSSQRGVVFYPDGGETLESRTYTLKVEADGYSQNSQEIVIDNLTHIQVTLSKI
ncbi:MAG: hypothetical protein ACD_67C00238G0004 [uncultured bacterium]|nr:MAG: hypothetical protein ACD_67C00238G0004 [uncultured bacterium]